MKKPEDFSRREFIRRGGLLLTGTTAYTLIPNYAWATDNHQLETLALVCYAMYPHRHVPLKHYKACAQGLLDKADSDAALKQTLNQGITRLDRFGSQPFKELSEDNRALALQRVENTPFFASVRGHTIVGLYNIPGVWQYFGYPGSSFEHGGYINRGLDDIFWLKDV